MIVSNETASLGVIGVSYVVTGQLKSLIKGDITFSDFWTDFAPLAKQIAKTGFENVTLTFPKVYNYKDCLQITIDQPYTQNSCVVTIHGGTFDYKDSKIYYPNKVKKDIRVKRLTNGLLMETPLHMVVNSLIQREYAKLRKAINYPKMDAIGKSRADIEMIDLEKQVDALSEMPPASYLFPENMFCMNSNSILVNNAISTPWLNGLTTVTDLELSDENRQLMQDYFTSAIDAYKGVFGVGQTIEEIKIALADVGVIVESDNNWVKIPDLPYHTGSMSLSLRRYLENYPQQVLALFPYFLKNTYYAMELTGAELGSTLYDFSRVLQKLFGVRVKDHASNMLADKYELLADIRAKTELPVSMEELAEFALLLGLRTGDIQWEVADDIVLDIKQLRRVKEAMEDLRNPISTLDESRQSLYTYKATQKLVAINVEGTIINLKATGKNWVASASNAVKAVMNPISAAPYEMMELFEQIQSIYLACLDSSLTTSDLYSIDQGTYKFKINAVLLSQQMHYAFTGANPVFVLAANK